MSTLYTIPLDPEFSQKFDVEINGIDLIFKIEWNDRSEKYHLYIYDSFEVPLLSGVPLNVNTELVDRFKIVGLPEFKMALVDTTLKDVEAAFDELGGRTLLMFQAE